MSKYTTEVRFICEFEAGYDESKGYTSIDEILTLASPKIFNFNFPIFDENYRLILEKKILKHFYTREICEETYGLWKLRLDDKMNMIMPYYNKLYNSELIEFNPLYDTDYTINHSGQASGQSNELNRNTRTLNTTESEINGNTRTLNTQDNNSSSSTPKNDRWDLYSDTPQGGINGITADNDSVSNNTYLTNARHIIEDGTGTTSQSINAQTGTIGDSGARNVTQGGTIGDSGGVDISNSTLDSYIDRVSGKRSGVSYSKLIQEFRETLLNIDAMIIKELEPLFFGLWN